MVSALALKTWRDLWLHRRQSVAVIVAIATSTITLGAILISYDLLSKAMDDNYQRSIPTKVTYQLEELHSPAIMAEIRKNEHIQRADLSRVISGTLINQNGQQLPLILFVVRDFKDFRLDIVELESGHWPNEPDQIVIEKQAMSVLKGSIGEKVKISTSDGLYGEAKIVAVGHDVSVAQAEWENLVYGYIDTQTLLRLGGKPGFNQLKVGLDQDLRHEDISNRGEQIQQWLQTNGLLIKSMRAASGEPPHTNITDGMFMMQIAFGIMCSLLSTILVVNLISAILSKQVFQIGVMKSLGAKPHQIKQIYLFSTFALCAMGMIIGLTLAYWVARIYAEALANMMNIDILDFGISPWVFMVLVLFGFIVPILTVLRPVSNAAKITVREALMDFDANPDLQFPRCLNRLFSFFPAYSRELLFSARNIFRKKTRFVLTSVVMAVGGAILITTFNVTKAMNQAVQRDDNTRLWHTKIRLSGDIDVEKLTVPDTESIMPFKQSRVELLAVQLPQQQDKISLIQLKKPVKIMQPKMLQGDWLSGEKKQIVFSHLVAKAWPEFRIGDTVRLDNGESYTLTGIAEKFGLPSLYTTLKDKSANGVYLTKPDAIAPLKAQLANQDIYIKKVSYATGEAKVIVDHFEIIFTLLLVLAVIALFIAGQSIILTTSVNTQERTREIGILKAIGARKSSIYAIILGENLWSGILAWVAAYVLAIPVSWMVSSWLGMLLVSVPFPLAVDYFVVLLTMPLLLALSVVSAYIPARRINGMPVRIALMKV